MRPFSLFFGFLLLVGVIWQFLGGPVDSAPYVTAEIFFSVYNFFYTIAAFFGYARPEWSFQLWILIMTLLWLLAGIYLVLRGLFGSSPRKVAKLAKARTNASARGK